MFKSIAITVAAVTLAAASVQVVSNTLSTDIYVAAQPATFEVSALNISPVEASPGEVVTISVQVSNIGEAKGEYELALVVNDETVQNKSVVLAGGTSTEMEFLVSYDTEGTYDVTVGGLTGLFTVKTSTAMPWLWIVIGIVIAVATVAVMIMRTLGAESGEKVPLKQAIKNWWLKLRERLKARFRKVKSAAE